MELLEALRGHVRNAVSFVVVVAGSCLWFLIEVMCLRPRTLLQDARDVVFVVFDRARLSWSSCRCLSVCLCLCLCPCPCLCLCLCLRLSSVGVELRFCMSCRGDAACSLVVIVLSWGRSFCVLDALSLRLVRGSLQLALWICRCVVEAQSKMVVRARLRIPCVGSKLRRLAV